MILTETQRCDPRTYCGLVSFRLPSKSARLARLRRNRQTLEAGQMLRPRLIAAAVHSHPMYDFSRERKITIQYAPRWKFARGDTFPDTNHGREVVHYGERIG